MSHHDNLYCSVFYLTQVTFIYFGNEKEHHLRLVNRILAYTYQNIPGVKSTAWTSIGWEES